MAGILDSKSRIMDVVITDQGRRQLASGQMRIEFATFTDVGSFYAADENDVISDPSGRIYFEAASDLPSDMITFETDDSGFLIPYRSDEFAVAGSNMLISGSARAEGDITGAATAVSRAILESWSSLQAIGTYDPLDETQDLLVSRQTASFSIRDGFPFTASDVSEAVIDDIEGLNHDFRLSKLRNFRYLPPVNYSGVLAGAPIAQLPDNNETLDLDTQRFEERISKLESVDFEFIETSSQNNFVMQAFELSGDTGITKLDVIDYGERSSSLDRNTIVRTLFVGKILVDGFGNPTFVNIFTVEMNQS